MDKEQDLLAIATTAIRDLYMGYPEEEIVAASGTGLKTLLKDLVSHLRESGVDDQGGWDSEATSGIAVRRHSELSFQPFKLFIEACAVDEHDDGPAFLEVTVNPEFIGNIRRLHALCKRHGFNSALITDLWAKWDRGDDLCLRGDSIRVYRDGDFWFEAHRKGGGDVESRAMDIDNLAAVAQKGPGVTKDGRFAWRNGSLFYSDSDPDELADLVTRTQEEKEEA